ncbi:type I polyketide synthase [Streptomyces sp. SP18CS02]|uniref:type I polyketide synthase n=1 Tax=Streptomyces sp. SP18CS02 TaxID=3002531 RepID=UPI002E781029|nr:type I polyketide synthase [Streptomyces sp. SP18CS02]MEE1757447.1 type I polyketide synthase [Streptomyces sp. SP18CS02]
MRAARTPSRTSVSSQDEPVAIVGLACRFPGAPDADAYWRLLSTGGNAISDPPPGRGVADRPGGFLEHVDRFDPDFFGISPREAAAMDPQQRLILELSWEAFEDAGTVPSTLAEDKVGVFVGAIWDDYATLLHQRGSGSATQHSMTGLHRSIIANRVSYAFDLRGPSMVVDTGQSSSLVAVHMACESLRRGEATVALAGGVNLNITPDSTHYSSKFGGLSPDHRCFTFDARANGYVRGEGAGVVVLKPLSRALADGDRVYCVIEGTSVNNDGAGEGLGLTVPTSRSQEAVLREAYEKAGVDPADVQYVELHGTGTKKGDPIESAALGAVLGAARSGGAPLSVGSVKTNIGHLEAAAGVAGLIKTALSIRNRKIPASLNFVTPHPDIPFDRLNLRVQTSLGDWPETEGPVLAGVSSFGMGGTNCHVVLSDAVTTDSGAPSRELSPAQGPSVLPWVVSGRSREALRAQAEQLAEHVSARPGRGAADIGAALAGRRTAFEERAVVLGSAPDEFLHGLGALARDLPAPNVVRGSSRGAGSTAFLFTGQGSQRPGMGRHLYETVPAFAQALDEVCERLDAHLPHRLKDLIFAEPGSPNAALLDRTWFTQAALFALEVALFRLLERSGVRPGHLIGHSIGELTAAHAAGVLSLEDACTLVAARGRLMQQATEGGAMIVLEATEAEAREALAGHEELVSVGAVNGPRTVVISGDGEAAAEIAGRFAALGRRTKALRVSHAFHSSHMDGVLDEFLDVARRLTYHEPVIPVVSNVTGRIATAEELCSPEYWVRHIREGVRFFDGVRVLAAEGVTTFLELGPGGLTAMTRESLAAVGAGSATAVVPLLRDGQPEDRTVAAGLAEVFVRGEQVDWEVFAGWAGAAHVELPTYAFRRQSYWLDTVGGVDAAAPSGSATDGAAGTAGNGTGSGARAAETPGSSGRPPRTLSDSDLLELVRTCAATVLGHLSSAGVDTGRTFKELGFDSLTAVEFQTRVAEATGLTDLSPTLVYNHPTPAELVRHLSAELSGEHRDAAVWQPSGAGVHDEPIAIVGMGCRFPGDVRSPEDLWRLIAEGKDAISGFPTDRGWGDDELRDPENPDVTYARDGGFLYDAAAFDAAFFGISPREALAMDPQQRLVLETSWEALERAGIDPTSLRGGQVGVFTGATAQDYGPRLGQPVEGAQGYLLTGNTASVISGRVAYSLGLEGPALTVDTACSSSLAALHLASRSLQQGECTMALAGGVTVMPTPGMFVEFAQQRGLAPDGRCKPFAAAADGTGWSEGVGMVVLERLSDARRHGHEVLAIVRGSAVNQDGASNGLTAPNGPSQERVIRQALANAGLAPADIDAVEAHGTGTKLGDPIEAQALLATYGKDRSDAEPLRLGSVKSNIGHTQAAAGIAGVIKMVMAMRHGRLPASLHIDAPTPHVNWSSGTVSLLTDAVEWPRGERVRRAGVSSFGISGTNVHAILEQAPEEVVERSVEAPGTDAGAMVAWPLSARTPQALRGQAAALRTRLDAPERPAVADTGLSLATTRAAFEHRAVLLGEDHDALAAALDAVARGGPSDAVVSGVAVSGGEQVFVFPGQGAQWEGMAVRLLDSSPVFRERMRECDEALGAVVDWSLLDVLRGVPGAPTLERVDVVQPVLFAMMVSLAALWESYGVRPSAVVGHSQGEIAAACVAGGLSLADAARIVALRSQALTAISGLGGMVSVSLSADAVRRLPCWDERLDVAVINGPSAVVVSGEPDALEELLAACAAQGTRAKRIPVSYAAHSAQVEAIREPLLEALSGIEPRPAGLPFYSTVTGELLDTRELDAEYWYRNLREPVQFERAMGTILQKNHTLLIEVSPHPVLNAGALEAIETLGASGAVVGSLRRGEDGAKRFLTSLAEAYVLGAPVDWARVYAGSGARRVDLPTYAFQHQRYWLTAPEPAADAPVAHDEAEQRLWQVVESGDARALAAEVGLDDPEELRGLLPALAAWRRRHNERAIVDSWRYQVAWEPLPKAPPVTLAGRWLVAVPDGDGAREAVAACTEALSRSGAEVVPLTVVGGTVRKELTERIRAVAAEGAEPAGVLSLLALAPVGAAQDLSSGNAADTLTLVQALGDAGVTARLWCVTRGAVAVGAGDSVTAPGQARIWGLGRVAAVEHAQRWGGLIDLPADAAEAVAGQLPAVLAAVGEYAGGADGAEDQVAVRGAGVFARRLVRAPRRRAAAERPWTPRGTVLVTGGTGALGAHTARWLAANGAEHIVLASRRGPEAPGAVVLEAELGAQGARVTTVACDVADRDALAGLLASLDAEGSELRAVVHTAGVIENTPLGSLTPGRFAEVLAAKSDAALHLHELTRERKLDAFVLFSSVSGMWGSAGNGGYAAANAYLDALAEYRRALGLPATSVIWGPWAGDGMMSRDGMDESVVRHGIRLLDPERAMVALQHSLDHDETSPVLVDVEWDAFFQAFTAQRPSRLLTGVPEVRRALREARPDEAQDGPAESATLAQRLTGLNPGQRRELASGLVRAQVAAVLGHAGADAVGDRAPFKELGVDSVIAVELRNRLQTDTGLRLPLTVIFDHPTLEKLVDHLLAEASDEDVPRDDGDAVDGGAGTTAQDAERAQELLAAAQRIDEMDAEDLVRLVLAEESARTEEN